MSAHCGVTAEDLDEGGVSSLSVLCPEIKLVLAQKIVYRSTNFAIVEISAAGTSQAINITVFSAGYGIFQL